MATLNKDVSLNLWGSQVVIPKGTEVMLIKGADGRKGDLYAVRDPKFLMELTGNTHDPKYRYAFVDHAAVDK